MSYAYNLNEDVHHQPQGPQGRAATDAPMIYTIVQRMPIEADGRLRYRIKGKSGNIERVVTEDELSYSQWFGALGDFRSLVVLNDRENILSALREKPLKVYEVMKRANVVNEEACQSLLLKMRDEGLVKFDIHKGRWLIAWFGKLRRPSSADYKRLAAHSCLLKAEPATQ
jgi:hypothetical protein